jgi:hypothetical protein
MLIVEATASRGFSFTPSPKTARLASKSGVKAGVQIRHHCALHLTGRRTPQKETAARHDRAAVFLQ